MIIRRVVALALLSVLWAAPFRNAAAFAELAPGDVIDRTNWQSAEGLMPEAVLNWVKRGDGTMAVGAVPYEPGQFFPPAVRTHLKANVGRYDVDDEGLMIDVETGKLPKFIDGLPFPVIDPADPRAGDKIMYNKHYYSYACGNIFVPFQGKWVGRKTGFEREISCEYWAFVWDGWSPAKKLRNPENVEMYSLIRLLSPYDIRGTNVLTWRYRDKRQDSTFAYVPAIRRARRMSPANRSDAFVGSDFCVDDAWGYGGKINAFEWKVVRKADQLVPFYPGEPIPLVENDAGEWEPETGNRRVTYGYQKQGYQGAPWWPQELIYVKRPTYILECKAKDRYYNYGIQYLWVDAEIYTPTYKVIHDRAGVYWKVEWQSLAGSKSADGHLRMVGLSSQMAVDDRAGHAGILVFLDPKNTARDFAHLDRNDFSLGGFQKLCK